LILAKSLIERFYNSFMNLDEAILAVCYIMYQTKQWIDGCGGKTDLLISSIKKDVFTTVGSHDIELVEKHFGTCETSVNSLIINLLNPNCGPERIDTLMSRARTCSEKAIGDVYSDGSRLSAILKRFAEETTKSKPKPSTSRKSKD